MAVFWFGLGKKIKNIFTKKEADKLYLSKTDTNLQIVQGAVDFYGNIVAKRNGYVDYVDTNAPTSMINKQYFETELNSYADKQYVYDYVKDSQNLVLLDQSPDNIEINNLREVAVSLDGFNYNLQAPVIIAYQLIKKSGRVGAGVFYHTIKLPLVVSNGYSHCVGFNDMYYDDTKRTYEKTDKHGLSIKLNAIDNQTKSYTFWIKAQLFGQAETDFFIHRIYVYGVR